MKKIKLKYLKEKSSVQEVLFDLNDICIVPAEVTDISSRSLCDTNYIDDFKYKSLDLPIFTAPMTSVVNETNFEDFYNYFNAILPTTVPFEVRFDFFKKGFWAAFSLDEANYLLNNKILCDNPAISKYHICIDCANGHMSRLFNICRNLKSVIGNKIEIMTGNIANPLTYLDYCEAGIDYVRVGIGGGSVCTTAVQTGCFYPMGSLIAETADIKREVIEAIKKCSKCNIEGRMIHSIPKIVADGGFSSFDRCIKALAIGADYVMLGSMLTQTWESAAPLKIYRKERTFSESWKVYLGENGRGFDDFTEERKNEILSDPNYKVIKQHWGMSTVKAQKDRGFSNLKTSEGVINNIEVKYTLERFVGMFDAYLKSAMSYTNCSDLREFRALSRHRFTKGGRIGFMTATAFVQYRGNKEIFKQM